MGKKFLTALFLFGIVLTSCQKELAFENNGGNSGGGSAGDLLARIVSKEGSDSTVNEYEYDNNKRLIREKISGVSQGVVINNDLRIIRNSSGIIINTIQKNAELIAQGLDSAVSRINYNSATNRYTSRVLEISFFGLTTIDSTVFIYDAAGKIIGEDDYLSNPAFGSLALLSAKTEYTNGSSGINQTNISFRDPIAGGPFELLATVKYTYDGKVSPLILAPGEAAVIARKDLSATANASKLEFVDVANAGAGSFTQSLVYSYNSKNKPVTAVSTQTPGNLESNITYTYK